MNGVCYILFTTETSVYAKIVHRLSERIADFTNQTMTKTPTWVNSSKVLTKNQYHGGFPLDISNCKNWLSRGTLDVCFYKQNGASPQSTDSVIKRIVIDYTGETARIIYESD